MKIISPIILMLLSFIMSSCEDDCRQATLYYTPNCATIQAYVIFEDNHEGRVILHDIPPSYQQDSVKVCIKFQELGEAILTHDCYSFKAIKITEYD